MWSTEIRLRTWIAFRRRVLTRLLLLGFGLAACSHASPSVADQIDAAAKPDAYILPKPDASSSDATKFVAARCGQPRPEHAPVPVTPPPPAAGCPAFVTGHNPITSSGVARDFILVLPANLQPTEKLPVLFMWHWLGADADSFYTQGDVQAAADSQRFIGVIPNSIGADVLGTSFDTKWPFDITQSQDRMNQEFTFFDDLLSCVETEFNVDADCVSTIGVSAGALFTDQLAQARSTTLASFLSLSGGVNDTIIKPWAGAARHLPGIVLWGGNGPPMMDGNKDILGCFGIGMDFSVASQDLEAGLVADNHFFVECIHNCGHVEPPLDPPAGESKLQSMWEFVFAHPFWLPEGTSPYQTEGLPADLPPWCGIGAHSATPRSGGGCPPAENPCTY